VCALWNWTRLVGLATSEARLENPGSRDTGYALFGAGGEVETLQRPQRPPGDWQ
jgi:hypothetical protein